MTLGADDQEELFRDFARDVSGGESALMVQVNTLIVNPPTTLEDIGYYGLENAPHPERTLRGIISALTEAGHLLCAEDKYIYEFPLILMEEGLADAGDNPEGLDLRRIVEAVDWDAGEQPDWPAFKQTFADHTRQVEQAVARTGNRLLSVQLPLGDTLHFWVAPEDMAKRWQGTTLYSGPSTVKFSRSPKVTIKITSPDWINYWSFLTYAFRIPKEHNALPEGLDH